MLLALMLSLSLTADPAVSGAVKDMDGGAIPGASVVMRSDLGGEQQTVTGPDGRFSFDRPPSGTATLIVRAGGFAVNEQPLAASGEIEIVLFPAPVLETVTVTPTRGEQRLGDIPASVNVIDSERIRQSPAVVADDALRGIPSFSLFTRASSLSSHPTSQGVSLRGVGGSGAGRTLVMMDGIPANDPFGGWVYWTRVPLESVERIEMVDGPSSSLYGNYAMGGVINIVSSAPARQVIELTPQYGSRNTPKIDFFGSDVWGRLGASVAGSAFDTEGFPIVQENERGLVDDKAAVNFRNLNLKLNYNPTNRFAVSLRTGFFRENRDNGKHSTVDGIGTEEANDTTLRFVNGGVRVELSDGSELQGSLFSNFNSFHSNFLAVPAATPARSIGRMSLNQTVPANDVGGLVHWGRAFGTQNYVTAGTDWHWVEGDSEEDALDAVTGTSVTLHRVSGGSQRSIGIFLQDIMTPRPKLTLTLAARVDYWLNYNGHNNETNIPAGTPGSGDNPNLPEHNETVVSPRVGANYHLNDRVSVWGDLSWGFRAPTLNELYRQFRKGTTLTLPNFDLRPERLGDIEGGVRVSAPHNLTVRFTTYHNNIRHPVFNVTTATVGANITQQRQNAGRSVVYGFQTDAEYRLGASWTFSAAYLHDHATVDEFDLNPVLVGKRLQQVPANRGSVQVVYSDPRYVTAAFEVQASGEQFDDDLNTPSRALPKYGVANLTVARTIVKNVDAFFGIQNMFNQEYFVATLPTTVGSPRLVSGGVRLRFVGR